MKKRTLICALFAIALTPSSEERETTRHVPPSDAPTFQRDSVERLPQWEQISDRSSAYTNLRNFGSRPLPIREAVESVPDPIASSRRLPLRDAIERRPAPDEASQEFQDEVPEEGSFEYQGGFPPVIVQAGYPQQESFPLVQNPFNPQTYFVQTPRQTYYSPIRYFQLLLKKPEVSSSVSFRGNKARQLFQPSVPFFHDFRGNQKQYLQEKRIVCYLEGSAVYRKEPMVFSPEDLDPNACTHLIYAFASLQPHTYTIEPRDEEFELVQGGYRAITGLKRKNPNLKVLISVGGIRDESSHRFSAMVSSANYRRDFIRSAIDFIEKYGFDGMDIHWQYPGADSYGGHLSDKEYFSYFLEEISDIFKERGWILSVAAPASRFKAEDGYDIAQLGNLVDFVNLQAYDFHNDRNQITNHHANLYKDAGDRGLDRFFNINYAVKFWLDKGLPASKLVLGIPFYGRSFTLEHSNETGLGVPIVGPGDEGYYTQHPGLLSYFEICDLVENSGWKMRRDEFGFPYATKEDQWVGYDDEESIKQKIDFANKLGLGGVYVWAVDLDDFKGICGQKYPLLTTIKRRMNVESFEAENSLDGALSCPSNGLYSDPKDCAAYFVCKNGQLYHMKCASHMMFDPTYGECGYIDPSRCRPGLSIHIPYLFKDSWDNTLDEAESGQLKEESTKVVCYFTNWAFYRKAEGKFVPENLDSTLCTHIIYAFATLDPEKLLMKEFDPWADIENNLYERVISNHNVPVLLSLGGWTDSSGDKYSRLVSNGSARRKFVVAAVGFLRRHGFNGLHLDWNYPVCWQSNCNKGPATDKINFSKLVLELKAEFKKQNPPLLLSAAVSGYKEVIDVAYDLRILGDSLDFISVMTYDYHGSWEKRTGHVSPLYSRPGEKYPQYSTNFTMEYLVKKGAPRGKLLVGIPFYGQTFTVGGTGNFEVGTPSVGPGEPGEYTKQPGMLAYYEICHRIKNQRWIVKKDRYGSSGPYAHGGDQWVGYEDIESVKLKAAYIKSSGFGGAVAWTVDLDDFNNRCCQGRFPLLRSLNAELGLIAEPPREGDCSKPPTPVTPPAPTMTTGVDTGAEHEHEHEHEHHHTTEMTTKRPSTTTSPWWVTQTTTSKKPTTTSPWWTTTTTKKTTTTAPWWVTQSTTTTTTTKKPTTSAWWTTERTTTQSSWQEGTTIPPPAVIQPEMEDSPHSGQKCEPGTHVPDPYNCNAYYRCILGELKKQYCAGGLHWNKQINSCDWPIEAKCERQNSGGHTTKRPTSTKKPTVPSWQTRTTSHSPPTTTRRPTTGSLQEKCQTGMYYPHENCNMFYVCVNGQLFTQSCAPGLNWNVDTQMCDWEYRIKCLGRIRYGDSDLEESGNELEETGGSCETGSFSAYPGDCSQYYNCLWGKYEVFQCAPGLHWNDEKKICDWPMNAKCNQGNEEGIRPPSEVSTNKPTYKPSTSAPEWKPSSTTDWRPPTTTRKPTATPEPLDLPPNSGYFKIVCYFTNWAWYRRGIGKYVPEDIDPDLCTHIVYGFAVLDYERLIVKAHDSWADYDNNFYERVTAYKAKGLKVSLALGGWNDSQGDKYSRLVNNPAARARFIKHVLEFLEKYNFDGLDLDWEYPKCWQVDCKKGPDSDKEAFASWVRELHAAFKPKGLLLSAAVSPSKTVIDAGYDVPTLGKYLDWVAVMTYDYHGQWDKKTGHVAPLFLHPEDEVTFFNANYSINYWISEGVPRRKIIMGMPLYGQSFQLENEKNRGLNANAPGPGQAGEFTRAAGFLAYYEICDRVKNRGWTVVQDEKRRMGPYAYKGNQWVSYDDKEMIGLKSEFIRRMDLGGGMIWALDLDDFRNRCGEGRHPLLSTIRTVLAAPGTGQQEIIRPEEPVAVEYPEYESTSVVPLKPQSTTSTTVAPLVDATSEFKVVCYFTNWAWYRQGVGKYLPQDIDPELCTHIVYGFAVLNGDQMIIKPHDTWADFDNKFYEKVTALKSKGVKVLIAIGGWNDSAGDKYSKLVNNPSARRRFIEHVLKFIEENNFDGLDLDWEYPKCWQVDCNKGPDSDKAAFAEFVRELHEEFEPRGLLLSAAVSPSKRVIDAGYDVPALSRYLDWIAVMCYDYHGQWDKITGHVAPFYDHPEDVDATFNTNFSINYWISKGADRKKIVMGMPMYGQSFSLADNSENSLNAPTYGGGEAGEETRARGFLAYYEICSYIKNKGWKVVRDKKGRIGPYAYQRDQWVSFDDIDMIRSKSEFIRSMGLGGGMIWALDLDDFKNICGCEEYPLLRTINRVLRNYRKPAPKCKILGEEQDNFVTTERKPAAVGSYPEETNIVGNLPCDGRLFVADDEDCNKYYLCNQGELQPQFCPNGLYWNKDHCDWPENTKCHPDATSIAPAITEDYEPVEPQYSTTTSKPPSWVTDSHQTDSEYKIVCYFTNWAWYRQGDGKYTPEDIDPSLCTHITYGFAVLDGETLTLKPHDSWADIDNNFYGKVVALRAKGIKVSIALGGWNDSLGDKYSRLVNDPAARARFVRQVIQFIEKWGFDGLDLDWEYPKCWQVDCTKGPDSDKDGFAALVAELRQAFNPKGLLLSAAVSPSKTVIDEGYDVASLSQNFDWIAVMTYDFHGHWDKQTGHVAPLYYYPGDVYDYFNANFSIHYWIERGAEPKKLIMGMPLYGQSFTLADPSDRSLNARTYGPGEAGEFTRAGGFLAFYEICERTRKRGWTVKRDPEGRIGPYAYMGNQWVSYDDIAEIRRKTKFLKKLGLGGGMIWALDLDDFRNRCGCGKHPLLKTLNRELRGKPNDIAIDNCT